LVVEADIVHQVPDQEEAASGVAVNLAGQDRGADPGD
jgi:hypothetical protein